VTDGSGAFTVTMDEIRAVAQFALANAETVLPLFEAAHADDDRPRAALSAAALFAGGAPRSNLQRTTSVEAHRAAKTAGTEVAALAASAAGDAAASAYLHPLAKAHQVGHILRAAACTVRIAEIEAGEDAGARALARACNRATPTVVDVLKRYPSPSPGGNPVSQLVALLDATLRR
jgi:hypothetical protein